MAQVLANGATTLPSSNPLFSPEPNLTSPKKSRKINVSNIGRKSSIGDVGTIRTKLHERRSQLNREITVEERITQGSKKLSKMSSLDNKTRDLANLEHEYSKSKIQVLQTELSRINSSIQAYQPESARDKQIPLIPIALKTTSRISFVTSFSEIANNHYHVDPLIIEDAVRDFQELRCSMSKPTKDESGIDLLYKYFSHLVVVGKRFLHHSLSHGIIFLWHDAINGIPAAQKSTVYEKACVVFNIGCLHTQIAAQQDRSTPEAIDKSIKQLEKALGVFEYMKHYFSHSPTMDMTIEILSLLSDLMRAQIVELQWDKEVMDGLDIKQTVNLVDYAQKNKSIAECYKPIRDLVDDSSLKDYLPSCWSALIKIKDAHYKSQAHYYAAIIHERLGLQCIDASDAKLLEIKRASIATELHFMYTTETIKVEELFSPNSKSQLGLAKSHLNCASLLHEYALRYKNLCKELESVTVLQEVLENASALTQARKDAIHDFENVAMIAPTIQPSIVDINPVLPNFTRVKVEDTFQILGPLSKFSAENSWSKPRRVTLPPIREKSFGFSIRGCKPARISGIDEHSSAKKEGVLVGDWIISVNGKDVKHLLHTEIVKLVQEPSSEELVLEITTPTIQYENPTTPTTPNTHVDAHDKQ